MNPLENVAIAPLFGGYVRVCSTAVCSQSHALRICNLGRAWRREIATKDRAICFERCENALDFARRKRKSRGKIDCGRGNRGRQCPPDNLDKRIVLRNALGVGYWRVAVRGRER